MIKKKLYLLIGFVFLLSPMISAYAIYNSSAQSGVIFKSLGLNSQINITFNINFSEADVTPTAITFYDLSYVHPSSCIPMEYLPVYSYVTPNYNITSDNFPYTYCSNPPGPGDTSGTIGNTSNFSQANIKLTYDTDWAFNIENQIQLDLSNNNKSFNASYIRVYITDLNNNPIPQVITYNYSSKAGTYIFRYIIPQQNITSIKFTFQVNKDGYNIIKTATINISDGKKKNIIDNIPNVFIFVGVIGLLILIILLIYWKYRRAKHRK
jgi:hypothetical protein